ncbi:hypothetical protein DPMN_129830 [Dreissena polymorpha]|uniref:Uncharacterized protein n=1 Tax=Dreissena polymorpha TaxID=45954 RepID=A0A9D4JXS6_DREPO|nr:hypothetical protein DPMN_129830 [Dreissena polymorpha]
MPPDPSAPGSSKLYMDGSLCGCLAGHYNAIGTEMNGRRDVDPRQVNGPQGLPQALPGQGMGPYLPGVTPQSQQDGDAPRTHSAIPAASTTSTKKRATTTAKDPHPTTWGNTSPTATASSAASTATTTTATTSTAPDVEGPVEGGGRRYHEKSS